MTYSRLSSEEIQAKAKNIKLLALDVDGVLTEGYITYTNSGDELKNFNVKDGLGLKYLREAGIKLAIITGRESNLVERRANDLKITNLFQGVKNKLPVFDQLLKELNLSYEEAAFMGDDLIDLEILQKVGLAACPKDAVEEVLEACHFVSSKNGGQGAVRELCSLILKNI